MLLVIALGLVWRWLSRHEDWIKRRLTALLAHPRVAALRRRYAAQLAFLQARLSPRGYLGLHLTIGALVLIASAWLFGGITEDIMHGDPLAVIDVRVSEWLHARMAPPLTTAMMLITQLGSTLFVSGATLLIAVLLLRRRQQYDFVALVVAVFGGMLLNVLLKSAFHRHRPSFNDPVIIGIAVVYFVSILGGALYDDPRAFVAGHFTPLIPHKPNNGFPSDHVLWSAATAAIIFPSKYLSLILWLLTILVGASRVHVSVHYPIDIVGSIAIAIVVAAIVYSSLGG